MMVERSIRNKRPLVFVSPRWDLGRRQARDEQGAIHAEAGRSGHRATAARGCGLTKRKRKRKQRPFGVLLENDAFVAGREKNVGPFEVLLGPINHMTSKSACRVASQK
jgi:hypothetical protein